MKRIYIIFLFLASVSLWCMAVNPANLISESIESKNLGENNDTIAEFAIGPVHFITDNSGSATYKNGWIRNKVEWCLYRSYNDGSLLVKANDGYWIKDVTFYYSDCKSGGMLADTAGASQKKIAAYDSAKAIVVNAPEKQFYVGKTSTGNGGYLSITKFAVTYCKTPESISMEDLTVGVGASFQLTPEVLPAGADAVYAWKSDDTTVVAIDHNGVIRAKAAGEANISASIGNVSDTCKITVIGCTDKNVRETFSRCTVEKNYSGTTDITGDNGLYSWEATNYQRQLTGSDDQIKGQQGIRVRYSGSIAMDSIQEGGIKTIAFDWRTANNVNIVNYRVQVGEESYEYNSDAIKNTVVSHFERSFEVKENTTFSVNMSAKIGQEGQCYVIVGPITITPYLLFTPVNRSQTIVLGKSATYNLNNVLINNTGEAPEFTVKENTTGATTSIVDGVLAISDKQQAGVIAVQASWNNQQVTTTLTLNVENLPETGSSITETFSNCQVTEKTDGREHVVGDRGIYDWSIKNFQRVAGVDTVNQQLGVRVRYNGSISSSGDQEGGVKSIAFDWRATGPGNPIHFFVQVDSLSYEYASSPVPVTQPNHFIRSTYIANNTTIKILVPPEENPAQSYVIIGPLTITPYLLFTAPEHRDTLRMADTTCYDLYERLIDNTDSVGSITYEILSDATGVATLEGSVVKLGEVKQSGAVDVKATWGEVNTTMTLWVEAVQPSSLSTILYNWQSAIYNILGQPIDKTYKGIVINNGQKYLLQ